MSDFVVGILSVVLSLLYPKSVVHFISQRRLYYLIIPGFSLKASLLRSWQCPAFQTSQSTESCNLLKS